MLLHIDKFRLVSVDIIAREAEAECHRESVIESKDSPQLKPVGPPNMLFSVGKNCFRLRLFDK